MFDTPGPRVFGLPPGADFATALVAGIETRLAAAPPEAWARITLYVSSGRMARRLKDRLAAGPARLLPRVRLVTDLTAAAGFPDIPPALTGLQLKLELAALLSRLIARQPGLAPTGAVFDLAESLAALIDEMEGEGVTAETLAALDVGGHAIHWQRSQTIVQAAFAHFATRSDGLLAGAEARRRRIVATLADRWQAAPPTDPVLVAGSTGSRGATRALMEAVAGLPQGALILPGYDFDQPETVWAGLDRALTGEDHPQFRFATLLRRLDLTPGTVHPWTPDTAIAPNRNRLVSLALRPAPVTDAWRDEGPALPDPAGLTQGMSLLEAASPRAEAAAIAIRLRQAIHLGETAALVTPDRALTRRVTAFLDRWGILPDDSAGTPLNQSAPGRLLRQTAGWTARGPSLAGLIALLKHPLTARGPGRGPHLRHTRELELALRHNRCARPTPDILAQWARKRDGRTAWADWLTPMFDPAPEGSQPLTGRLHAHLSLTQRLAAGPDATPGALWDEAAGAEARRAMDDLAEAASAADPMTAEDYRALLDGHLSGYAVQDPRLAHPSLMIWGTLEARVQGADLVILAGLNEGTWPANPTPDPWLNRQMRSDASLLLPDRQIGLSAHDFQQAIGAKEVLLTRALRDEAAETVPSRWLNRLTNLLGGLGTRGQDALAMMRGRGTILLDLARALDRPALSDRAQPAPRPAPAPPLHLRPRRLPVTSVGTLIRDPYAVYARRILGLRPLNPLTPEADALVRGTALHRVMERFVEQRDTWRTDPQAAHRCLSDAARTELAAATPEPAMRAFWHARFMAVADRIVAGEMARLADGDPVLIEEPGGCNLSGVAFRLIAKPDRIDRMTGGGFAVYDYKTGRPKSASQVDTFEKQLPLEAALVERGGFDALGAGPVHRMAYIGLGATAGEIDPIEIEDKKGARRPDRDWTELHRLIASYGLRSQGYTARRAVETTGFAGDYDHLARLGEWNTTQAAETFEVGGPDPEPGPGTP